MKRRYEVVRLDVIRSGLAVTVIVHEVGPSWKICVTIPWDLLSEHDIYDGIALGVHSWHTFARRQRERLDDGLF